MPSFWENLRFPGEREMDDLHGAQGQDMVTYVSAPSPSEGNSFPAVIVIMEAFGVTNHIEKVCDQYAANGYVAIAPALYHRQHPNPKLGYDEMPAVQQYMGNLQDDEIVEDVNVAIDYLQNHYQRTQGQKIGIVGYSFGTRVILRHPQLQKSPRAFAFISPSIEALEESTLKNDKRPKFVIAGTKDKLLLSD